MGADGSRFMGIWLASMLLAWLLGAGVAAAQSRTPSTEEGRDASGAADAPRVGTSEPAPPVREFNDAQGRVCRVYARQVIIAGEAQTALATVCRDANGRWVLSR